MLKTKTKPKPKTDDSLLTGEALLKRVQELEHLSKGDKAIECGYFTLDKDGNKRISLVKFLNALVEAEGIDLDGRRPKTGNRRGRGASFRTRVQASGTLLIGSVYTKQLNLSPKDEFEITLGRKHIKLIQVEP
jgi:AbrB-like transcriptional regulator